MLRRLYLRLLGYKPEAKPTTNNTAPQPDRNRWALYRAILAHAHAEAQIERHMTAIEVIHRRIDQEVARALDRSASDVWADVND